MKTYTLSQFKAWGSLGSKVRKHRKLTPAQARAMVKARERKRKERESTKGFVSAPTIGISLTHETERNQQNGDRANQG